ncbi:hypothetical protein AB0M80_17010 [Amycolatopsis sp. NPDC051045]|uniref:hypothetical protein n=1 Tax=Amycolatopsis sp. NPDC051045 TaxID=3156922 RepID=UPI00342ACF60
MDVVAALMAPVIARLARFEEAGDSEAIFGPEADGEAQKLFAAMFARDESGTPLVYMPAVLLLVKFHTARHNCRPDPQYIELGTASRLMSFAVSVNGELLTPQLQANLTKMYHKAKELDKETQSLLNSYRDENDLVLLDTAISKCTAAVNLSPVPGATQGLLLSRLSVAFWHRYQHRKEALDLDTAVRLRTQALAVTPPDDPHRTLRKSILADLYVARFDLAGDVEDLRAGIRAAREALEATPEGDGHVSLRSGRLARLLAREFTTTENLTTLEEAIVLGYQAVDNLTEEDEPDAGAYVSDLASWLVDRADHTGNAEDLDAAITLRRRVLDDATGDTRLLRLTLLGTALYTRYERTGRLDDLSEAVDVERLALAETPAGHPERRSRLTNLATSLRVRYEWLRRLPDLDEAITIGSEAVQLYAESHVLALTNLSTCFAWRFRHLFEPADLNRAISLTQRAVEHCPPDHPDRGMALATPRLRTQRPARTDRRGGGRRAVDHLEP